MSKARWLLFAALFLGAAFFHQPVEYDNSKSRYMLLSAMVDDGRFTIDQRQQDTVDKAFWNGHYYSNKAIGLPFLAAPFYWMLKKTGLVSRVLDDAAADYLVRVATVSLPFAMTGLLILELALALGAPPRSAVWAVVAYGFGTIAFNHAVLFSGHDTSAFFLFASFIVLYFAGRNEASRAARSTALGLFAGLCAGCAVLCDQIAVFGAVVVAWYALTGKIWWRGKAGFLSGAFLCAGLLAWYNLSCFGSIWSLAYSHNVFIGFSRGASAGLFGITWPDPKATLALLFSVSRGLFFASPVLIFSVAGLALLREQRECRREFLVLSLVPAANFLANAGFYGWTGGWTFGPRYLVPALPFLGVPLAFAADEGLCFALALCVSLFETACAQIGWPHVTPDCANPIVEMVLPLMKEGGTALTLLGGARPGLLWPGLAQYALVALACAAALFGLARPQKRSLALSWSAAAGFWSVWVIAALMFTRTPNAKSIHYHRALLLNDAAWAMGGNYFAAAADKEFALAGQPRGR